VWRKHKIAWYVFVLLSNTFYCSCTSINSRSVIEKLKNEHFLLQTGELSFEIDPNLGARIISARIGEDELLLQERKDLLNWGSTFWIAPQSMWNWPPPEALHLGKYEAEIVKDKLVLKSEVDQQFGFRVVKTILITDDNSLDILYQIINESDSVQQIGPWEVTVVPAIGAKVFFPTSNNPEGTNSNIKFPESNGISWFDYIPEELQEWHKIFRNPSDGWLAHINKNNTLFVKKFDVISPDEIAPGQGNVEVYISKKSEYIELENHGRYTMLNPGESLKYRVKWYIKKIDHEDFLGTPSCDLIDCVTKMFQ